MRNPLDIEQRYRDLLFSLSYPSTNHQRLHDLGDFLDYLGEEAQAYESYVQDTLEHLSPLIHGLHRDGSTPDFLQSMDDRLALLSRILPALTKDKHFVDARRGLRFILAREYAYAGNLEQVLASLGPPHLPHVPGWLVALSKDNAESRFTRLQRAASTAREEAYPLAQELDALVLEWTEKRKGDLRGALVPVIERTLARGPGEILSGMLRQVTVKISGEIPGDVDELSSDAIVVGAERGVDNALLVPAQAARSVLRETHPRLSRRSFAAHISFQPRQGFHEGRSANLAIAALFYCAALRFTYQRSQIRIRPTCAVTGDVNERGEVLRVDSGGLRVKVETVFFSHAEVLVVPREQLAEAEESIRELCRKYPDRRLDVLGISHLREMFYDLRVIDQKRATLPVHVSRQIWREKATFAGILIIAILALTIVWLTYVPIDRTPVTMEWFSESLLLKNDEGDLIDKVWVGSNTVERYGRHPFGATHIGALLADIDHDGVTEVMYGAQSSDNDKFVSRLNCKHVGSESLMWSVSMHHQITFSQSPDAPDNQYALTSLTLLQTGKDDRLSLYVIGTHLFFPSILSEVDPLTGIERASYLHTGNLHPGVLHFDIDADGKRELIIAGANNALRKAAVAILDPDFLGGHSPATERYIPDGWKPGTEKYYFTLPRSDVGPVLVPQSTGVALISKWVSEAENTFTLNIDEGNLTFDSNGKPVGANLFFTVGSDLRVRSIGTASDYDLVSERLYREGKIRRLPDLAYFQELKKEVAYWNGEGWQSDPVVNKWYLEAKKGAASRTP